MDKKKLKTYRDRLVEERDALIGVVGRNEDYGREADAEATQDPAAHWDDFTLTLMDPGNPDATAEANASVLGWLGQHAGLP